MSSDEAQAVPLVWDLRDERLTVGGALVLRQEGEVLARLEGPESLTLNWDGASCLASIV